MPDGHTWEGRSRGNTLGYQIFIFLLRYGGIRAAYGLLQFVALYYRFFASSATRPLQYLYHSRLGYPLPETKRLIRANLVLFGQSLIDKIAVLSGIKTPLTFTHDGIENIETLVKNGKGGILVSAHLGNWEIAGQLLERVDAVVNILMYDGEAEQIKAYMQQFEGRRSFNIIYVREDMSHIYELSAALNRNELVCMHADRYRPGNRLINHDFLGQEAAFPAGPFILASKLRAPVSFVFAFKETNFHYHFYSLPAKTYEGRGTAGVERMLNDYVHVVEEKLKKYPEQWYNYYDFWKI
jgi:predicted LPLAT superfamily acyltransferase